MTTIAELVERSGVAIDALATIGEAVAEEWQYIADVRLTWLRALDAVAEARGARAAAAETEAAVERLIDEIGRISDPHRAIDWLSTFPQAALLVLVEP